MCLQNLLIVLFNYFIPFKLHFFKFYYLVCVKKAEKKWKKILYGETRPSNSNSNHSKK